MVHSEQTVKITLVLGLPKILTLVYVFNKRFYYEPD